MDRRRLEHQGDGLQPPRRISDELRRSLNKRVEQLASASSGGDVCRSQQFDKQSFGQDIDEDERITTEFNKAISEYKNSNGVISDIDKQIEARTKILTIVRNEIQNEPGNKWAKMENLMTIMTLYGEGGTKFLLDLSEDAKNLTNWGVHEYKPIEYRSDSKRSNRVEKIIKEIRRNLSNWLNSNPEVAQNLQNARKQFDLEERHRNIEAAREVRENHQSIVVVLNDMRNQMILDQHGNEERRLHALLDRDQPEPGSRPRWPEWQRPEQQRHEQRHDLQAQLQRWKRSILRVLCGLTEQVNLQAMDATQIKEYTCELQNKVQGLDQPMCIGRLPEQRKLRKLEQWGQKAAILHQRVDELSQQGRAIRSGFQDAARTVAEVQLSIDKRWLENLKQRVSSRTTQGQLDRTRLGQLRREAEQLRQRKRINQTLLSYEGEPQRQRRIQSPLQQIMMDFRRQDNAIKDESDEIITNLRQLELPAMSPAELKDYANGLEQEVHGHLRQRTNLGQREQRQFVTRALDIQMHAQQQLENRQDQANRSDLESAGHKATRIIDRVLGAMNPTQLREYAGELLQEVQGHLRQRTNLGQPEQRKLVTMALDIQMRVQQRLENTQDQADRNNLKSAGRKASGIINSMLGAMNPTQLREYAGGLEQEVQGHLRQRTNLGQPEQRKLVTMALDIQMHVQQRLENTRDQASRNNLESAGRKANRIINSMLGSMNPTQLRKYANILDQKVQRILEYRQTLNSKVLYNFIIQVDTLQDAMDNRLTSVLTPEERQSISSTAHTVIEMQLSIDEKWLENLKRRVSNIRPQRQLREQLMNEAKQLRARRGLDQRPLQQQMEAAQPFMRQVRIRDNAIKQGADEIITDLRKLELPEMSPAELNQYAGELEHEAWQLPEETNLEQQEQRHLEQLRKRGLDVLEAVERRLASRQGEAADLENLESVQRKIDRSLRLIVDQSHQREQKIKWMKLQDMNPVEFDIYAGKLKRQVQDCLPSRANLGEQNRGELKQLREKAWQLWVELERQERERSLELPHLSNARNKVKKIIESLTF
jgi:hypothetical protein